MAVSFEDDGIGIGAEVRKGRGLANIERRAADLGGSVEVGAGRDGGTRVRAVFPVKGGSAGAVLV